MSKLLDNLKKQLKDPEHKKAAEDCIRIYNWVKETDPEDRVWSSRWTPLVDVKYSGQYPYTVRFKPSGMGECLLLGIDSKTPSIVNAHNTDYLSDDGKWTVKYHIDTKDAARGKVSERKFDTFVEASDFFHSKVSSRLGAVTLIHPKE